jgi:hypothetical protein
MAKYRVVAKSGLRARFNPRADAPILGIAPEGATIDVARIAGEWATVPLVAGGVALAPSALATDSGACYLRERAGSELYLTPVLTPIPQPVPSPQPARIPVHPKYQLGVNVLQSAELAEDAFGRGCRAALIMNNQLAAYNLARAYPDGWVMVREYHNVKLAPTQMADLLGLRGAPPNLIFTGANESDTYAYGTPDEIKEHFAFDRAWAEIIHQRNPAAKCAIGTFSHGCPDFTRDDIRQALRDTYVAFANDHPDWVMLDSHLYTKGRRFLNHPPAGAPIIEPEWFEMRYEKAYRECGLSANVVSCSGEHGVEAGAGGFAWAQYSQDQFREWANWWMTQQRASATPLLIATLFTLSNHAGWRGYYVQNYLDTLTELWRS